MSLLLLFNAATVEETGTGALASPSSLVAGTGARVITDAPGTVVDLTSQPSLIAGTATREITGAGALVSQPSAVAGAGIRGVAGTGALASQQGIVAGTATREITGTGALNSQASIVAGTGTAVFIGGELISPSATVAGTGFRNITDYPGTTVTLESQASLVAGIASREITGTGALVSQRGTVAGTAGREIAGTGAINSQRAIVVGTGVDVHIPTTIYSVGSDVSITARRGVIAGTAYRFGNIYAVGSTVFLGARRGIIAGTAYDFPLGSGYGFLQAQSATVSGSGLVHSSVDSFGVLLSQRALIAGTGVSGKLITGTGALQATMTTPNSGVLYSGLAHIVGTATHQFFPGGDMAAQRAHVSGVGTRIITKQSGNLQAQSAVVAGTGLTTAFGTGAMQAQSAVVFGVGELEFVHGAYLAHLQAQSAVVVGAGGRVVEGTGALVSQRAIVAGTASREITGTGALQSARALVSAQGASLFTGTGDLVSARATVFGVGSLQGNIGAYLADLRAQRATIIGQSNRTITGTGALVSQRGTVVALGAVGIPTNKFVLAASDAINGNPFYLTFTDDGTHVQIVTVQQGELEPCDVLIDPYAANQFGFRYWSVGDTHYWQYIVNGVLRNTVSITGSVVENVNSIAGTKIAPRATLPGKFDEILCWKAGNSLTDSDIYWAWESYYATPGFTSSVCGTPIMDYGPGSLVVYGFTDSICGIPLMADRPTSDCIFESVVSDTMFYSLKGVYTFNSLGTVTEFTSGAPDPIVSCDDCG